MNLKISNEHCKHECHLMFIKCLMMQCILTVGPPHEQGGYITPAA